jgi:putative acetyltransferase
VILPGTSIPLAVRPASNSDGRAVQQLVFGILEEYGLHPEPETTDADLFDLEGCYWGRGGELWVAETVPSPEIVGCIGYTPLTDTSCEIRKLYIGRAWRRQGIGKALFAHILERARDRQFQEARFETSGKMHEAIRMYDSLGIPRDSGHQLTAQADLAYRLKLQR